MFAKLNKHPFAVDAHFQRSLVLSYALPKADLEALIAPPFELDLFQDRYAFLAIAFVQVTGLRPSALPKCFGRSFILAGYRLFVRYTGPDGRRLRGLQILRSETNKRSIVSLGNLFTQYHYRHTPIIWKLSADNSQYITTPFGLNITTAPSIEKTPLPSESPFPDWRTARRFAGPMPFTFSYDEDSQTVTSVEGQRTTWSPHAVNIAHAHIPLLAELGLAHATLANSFAVENIPYHWKKGDTHPWPHLH